MLNRVVLQGRTTHHPELTHTKKGTAILRFSIAVNGINSTSFFDCFMKGKDAESHELMGKGTEVFIVGQLMQRRYKRKMAKIRLRRKFLPRNVILYYFLRL